MEGSGKKCLCLLMSLCILVFIATGSEAVAVDQNKIESFVKNAWSWEKGNESAIIKALCDYITIPNDSPAFDPKWSENGHMDKAIDFWSQPSRS
jgi:hypothetical protein